jgi:hypothetical protein
MQSYIYRNSVVTLLKPTYSGYTLHSIWDGVSLVEQELLTFLEYLSSPSVFSGFVLLDL